MALTCTAVRFAGRINPAKVAFAGAGSGGPEKAGLVVLALLYLESSIDAGASELGPSIDVTCSWTTCTAAPAPSKPRVVLRRIVVAKEKRAGSMSVRIEHA